MSLTGTTYSYTYQYKDHLGNIRLSYSDANNDKLITNTEIVEESNYYPFGLKQTGYNNVTNSLGNSSAQKYKYNGKELQDELGLNMYDYGARNYDATIGRWMNIDPLAEVSRRWSPYTYCYNNPIRFIDPDGMYSTEEWKKDNGVKDSDLTTIYQAEPDDSGGSDASESSSNDGGDSGSENNSSGPGDPPTTSSIKDFFKSMFNFIPKNNEEAEQSNTDRDFFMKVTDYWNEGNLKALEILATIMTIPLSATEVTATKGLVFFSGEGAEAFALKQGYKTLGQTKAGINLQKLITSKNIPWSEAKPMWARLSTALAKSFPKGSTVRVFVNNPSADSIWLTVEKKILEKNGVKIIYIKL